MEALWKGRNMTEQYPIIIAPEDLRDRLDTPGLVVIDLSKRETYLKGHVPGAVWLDYARIVRAEKPVMGLPPPPEALSDTLGSLGITPDTWVVACDDEGGGKAGRLLWTLDCVGHHCWSLIDGGLAAWAGAGLPLETRPHASVPVCPYPVKPDPGPAADAAYILAHLDDPSIRLLDCRSSEEYRAIKKFADRGGHIPGAVHYEWTRAMDPNRHLRLRPEEDIRAELEALGVTPEKEILAYCQTHHRSSFSYVMLKALGYPRIKGYPGSWSDWGNRPDTPVEV